MRVLSAVSERKEPDGADVKELQRVAPVYANLPIDELACRAINAAVEARSKQRAVRVPVCLPRTPK